MKKQNFKRLAEKRVTNILNAIRLLGNLSNKNNYEYTEQEIDKIFKTIQASLDTSKAKFKNKKIQFKL